MCLCLPLCPCLHFLLLRGDAVSYARLQHQKQADEEKLTGTTDGSAPWLLFLLVLPLVLLPLLSLTPSLCLGDSYKTCVLIFIYVRFLASWSDLGSMVSYASMLYILWYGNLFFSCRGTLVVISLSAVKFDFPFYLYELHDSDTKPTSYTAIGTKNQNAWYRLMFSSLLHSYLHNR